MTSRRGVAVDAVLKKRDRAQQARRKRSALHRRVWRRYPREPFWDLKTSLFAHRTVDAVETSVPSLDEVLNTIRRAWESPRCLASDREAGACEEQSTVADMGTDREMSSKIQGQIPTNPGLPHRRYSVPETVMRKYSLSKQQSGSSDSGVATVPVATPDTISSDPTAKPGRSSDDPPAETSSSHSSDHNSDKMGNTAGKGICSPDLSESAVNITPTKSTLDTVSEQSSKSVSGSATEDTLEALNSTQTSAEASSSTTRNHTSPEDITESAEPNISASDNSLAIPTVLGDNKPPSTPSKGVEPSSPHSTESTEPPSSVKDDLSPSQTSGLESTGSDPSSTLKKEEYQSPGSVDQKSVLQGEMSFTQTKVAQSKDYTSQSMHNKGSIGSSDSVGNGEVETNISRRDNSVHSEYAGSVHSSADERVEHQSPSMVKPSSSQMTEVESTESKTPITSGTISSTPGRSSGNRISMTEACSQKSTVSPDQPPLLTDMTQSLTPGGEVSERCVSPPDPERSHSLSSMSHQASESCSITPVESSISGSSPERPSVTMPPLISSTTPPSSENTVSTQDATLSLRSDSTALSTPSSIIRECDNPVAHPGQTQVSDSEKSIDHIDFMNESVDTDSRPILNMLGRYVKSQSAESNSQKTEDSGHATEPDCTLGEAKNNSKESGKAQPPASSLQLSHKQASTNTDSEHCRSQSKSWEIIIQPTVVPRDPSKCLNNDVACKNKTELPGNKMSILPSNKQDMEFCGSKTYLLIKPISSTTVQTHNAEFCGTATYPPTKSRLSPGIQAVESSSTASLSRSEDMGLYGWSRLTDEEHTVQLQLQRHRLWMNRRLSASNALPTSPRHGPIGSCVGIGCTYRKGYETQLVVPRYSALPRSISMLVNTSSGECSSNSNSDSDCLSLVDSLEERPSSCTSKHKSTKHDSKPVRGDILQLLPEDRNYKHGLHRRINAATPRGKGKAFFVSMETGLDEAGTVKVDEDIQKQVVSQSMPERLKKKLSQRHLQIDLKKNKKKRLKNQGEDVVMNTDQKENIRAEVETSGSVVVHAMTSTQSTVDKNALREMSETEDKPHEEGKATDRSVPIKTIHKKSPAGLPPSIKSSTGIFQPLSQSKAGERTFILSRNDCKEKNERKLPEKSIPVGGLSMFPSVENIIKKEYIPQEHSPPVKRFKASRPDFPSQVGQETPKEEEVNISQNGMTNRKEMKREEQSPLLKTSNSAEHKERKSPGQEPTVKTADSAGNGNKEQGVHRQEEECTLNVSKEVQKEVKPMKKVMPQETPNGPVEENMKAKEQKPEEQRPPLKTANGSKRKMQKGDKSAKETGTKKNSRNETNATKQEDQSLPVKTSTHETNNKKENKITNERKLHENGEGFAKESPSPATRESILKPHEKLEGREAKVPLKQLQNCKNLLQHNTKEQKTANRDDLKNNINTIEAQQVKAPAERISSPHVVYQKINHEHSMKSNIAKDTKSSVAKKPPEEKSLITVSCQTSPELKREDEKCSATTNTNLQSNIPESPPDPIKNRPQLPLKSAIPIIKSPIGTRKLSPDTAITFQQSLQNSHLPVHRQSRLLRTPQIRRSANLLGAKFHQRFEVIPEERSGSLESSAEDQLRMTTDRSPRSSLSARQTGTKASTGSCLGGRSNIVSHSCLGLNQVNKHKQTRHSASNNESSTSNHEESDNGNVRATNSDISRKVIRRPIRQSRIPMAEKLTRQPRIPEDSYVEQEENYQGKAALAPHTEDKDLLTLSKGWLNFYLLKDSCGTPDSSCGEAQTDVPEREKGISRKKGAVFPRTVTVVGGDDNRIRQYTVPSRLLQQNRNKDKEAPTILPELTSNHNMRRTSAVSLQKLPVALLKPNDSSAGSDNSTTYLCLPSTHLNANYLLEGSGELACSESSVSSSSDSECDPATLPNRLPTRQPQRGSTHHWSRSRKKHYKSEQFQSHSQSAGSGSAGWTVTVAGSNACPQQPPELEMRLSFPSCARRPGASQSDSGLGEDNNNGEKSKTQEQKDDDHFLPPAQSAPQPHKWTLMVKNQGGSERSHEISKSARRTSQYLPDLGHNPSQSKNSKKVLKRPDSCFPVTSIADEDTRKSNNFSLLWPKVKKIMESKVIIRKSSGRVSQEVKSISELLESEDGAIILRSGLGIKGSAITPERKPRVPTMSERDLTRSHTARH